MIDLLYDTGAFALIGVVVFLINAALFLRIMKSRFDPTWFVVIFVTLTVGLLQYEASVNGTITLGQMTYIWCCVAGFAAGANLLHAITTDPASAVGAAWHPPVASRDVADFVRVFLVVSTAIVVVFFGFRAVAFGIPIFQEDPEAARVLASRGGFGLISRIIQPLLYANFVLLFYARARRIALPAWWRVCCSIVTLVILLLSGYKAILIVVFIAYFCANTYAYARAGVRREFMSLRAIALTAVGALGFTYIVLYLRVKNLGIDDPSGGAYTQVLLRIMQHGLGASYFFSNGLEHVMVAHPTDYLWSFVIVPFLAPLRIVAYDTQTLGQWLGYIMVGSDVFGPNPSMFVEGIVFFGRVGGVLYCFVLGCMYALMRSTVLARRFRNEAIQALVFAAGNLIVLYVTMDMLVVIGDLFNNLIMFVAVVPLVVAIQTVATMSHQRRPAMGQT